MLAICAEKRVRGTLKRQRKWPENGTLTKTKSPLTIVSKPGYIADGAMELETKRKRFKMELREQLNAELKKELPEKIGIGNLYFFTVGQVLRYCVPSNSNYSRFNPALNAKTVTKLREVVEKTFKFNAATIKVNEKFEKAMALILQETNENPVDEHLIMLGVTTKSVF